MTWINNKCHNLITNRQNMILVLEISVIENNSICNGTNNKIINGITVKMFAKMCEEKDCYDSN